MEVPVFPTICGKDVKQTQLSFKTAYCTKGEQNKLSGLKINMIIFL